MESTELMETLRRSFNSRLDSSFNKFKIPLNHTRIRRILKAEQINEEPTYQQHQIMMSSKGMYATRLEYQPREHFKTLPVEEVKIMEENVHKVIHNRESRDKIEKTRSHSTMEKVPRKRTTEIRPTLTLKPPSIVKSVTRVNMYQRLSKTFTSEIANRILHYLQFPILHSTTSYKRFLHQFTHWTHTDILVFTFYILDTQNLEVINTRNLFAMIMIGNSLAIDARIMLKYQGTESQTSLIPFKGLTYHSYKQLNKHRTLRVRVLTNIHELPQIHEKKHRSNTHVSELYEDTKVVTISFAKYSAIFAQQVPEVYVAFLQAIVNI